MSAVHPDGRYVSDIISPMSSKVVLLRTIGSGLFGRAMEHGELIIKHGGSSTQAKIRIDKVAFELLD